ncbi:diphthine methyltransferase isoform X2 [Phymastichus coffea]|uniref:diphthine methyltransferase isoform X2 n=1 Tax=Phymastichus coffea TaxID=108790 RepID=UPI00273BFB3F|nr:diphthine methyltransferase isoform X2 [Phymastichus coffea]
MLAATTKKERDFIMFQTLESFDTELSADSVEWCPSENFQDIFVCGTYQLTSNDSEGFPTLNKVKRVGRIYLFQVDDKKLRLLQQLDVPAVLDMKWCHIKIYGKILLGVCNSEGYLQIYELIKDELEFASEIAVNDASEKPLALSLDWSTGRRLETTEDIKIVVSDSQGSVSLFNIAGSVKNIERISRLHGHDFEAWIAAFDYWNTNVLYTGGDDCKFLRFDTRINSPTHTNRLHNAGVTSLHSNWKKEYSLVSGSYDETLRTWDTRHFRRPLEELNLNGGIWRLKWDPYEARYLLAACMYNGFFIVDSQIPNIVAEYKEHKSIAYGCDWSFGKEQRENSLVATCSFYDHLLKLSSVQMKEL